MYLDLCICDFMRFEGTIKVSPKLSYALCAQREGLKVIEMNENKTTKIIGEMDNSIDHTFESANRVYDKEGIAPTLPTCCGGGHQPKIIDELPVIVASRGRNAENPSRRDKCDLEQRLEINSQGVSNTLTTVQKDNMVLDKVTIGAKTGARDLSSTILAGYHRTNMTGFNDDNGVMEKINVKQATKKGFIECDNGGVADLSYPTSELRRGRVQGGGQISPALTTGGDAVHRLQKNNNEYRIRKLTPKECWRLMSFSDEDFKKAEGVNSSTQLYKQAGNSIVKDCLVAIFSQLNIQGIKSWNNRTEKEKLELIGGEND